MNFVARGELFRGELFRGVVLAVRPVFLEAFPKRDPKAQCVLSAARYSPQRMFSPAFRIDLCPISSFTPTPSAMS